MKILLSNLHCENDIQHNTYDGAMLFAKYFRGGNNIFEDLMIMPDLLYFFAIVLSVFLRFTNYDYPWYLPNSSYIRLTIGLDFNNGKCRAFIGLPSFGGPYTLNLYLYIGGNAEI